ncbi:MAG: sigma 54-interacting transcriptional regulator [Myxococcota bacterium]
MLWNDELTSQRAEAVAALSYCNPFLSERIALEQQVLGDALIARQAVWTPGADLVEDPAIALLQRRGETLLRQAREAVLRGAVPTEHEAEVYDGIVLYVLYYRYEARFFDVIVGDSDTDRLGQDFSAFVHDLTEMTAHPGLHDRSGDAAHLFSLLFQIRRAFHLIFRGIYGASLAVAKLRATVWQSVFTHDQFRHQRLLYPRMHELTTLVTGPSGTGKELVARAIGHSGYIPFDEKSRRFQADYRNCFHPINVSAFSKTLVESELFGHKKGAFTGATADRDGYLHAKQPWDVVFLDEIGEVDEEIQVKLLRVLQSREFQRLGDGAAQSFGGKIIAATNRNLAVEMDAGQFRRDFFYRLCSDVIETPSLRMILAGEPNELENLVIVIVKRLLGEPDPTLVAEVLDTIDRELGASYAWPGNIRELEQCVRNVLVRGIYQPAERGTTQSQVPIDSVLSAMRKGTLALEDVTRSYCTHVYAQTGTFEGAAEALGVDRRTVSKYVDREQLDAFRQ